MILFPAAILAIADEGDRAFMRALYLDYHNLMCAQAYQVMKARQDLDDVVDEACEKLICKIPLLRAMDCRVLRAYLVTTVRNTALNRLSRASARRETGRDVVKILENEPSGDAPVDEGLLRSERVAALMRAIKALSERDQEVLRMKYILDLDDGEMARALNVKPNSVRACVARAKKRAYALLKEVVRDDE